MKKILDPFVSGATHNEADTEERVIYPVFNALGWADLILRKNTMAKKGHEDIPDALLLPDAKSLLRADKVKRAPDKFRHGVLICEAKKWELPLDQGSGDAVPSTQMLRYLTRADVMSEGRILWGVLTNGRIWRLYSQRAKSRSEQFLEIDFGVLLDLEGVEGDLFAPTTEDADQLLKIFVLMFRRQAFLPTRDKSRTFHDVALEEGRRWEAGLAKDLSDLTFEKVFPGLVSVLAHAAPRAALSEIRQAAMTLLYRLLFILYAEDRDLLPRRDARYEDHGLFKRVRQEVAKRIDDGVTFSTKAAHYWDHARTLFHLIDGGDAGIGLPPYNGGLFDKNSHALLEGVEIADATFAPLVDKLSRTQGDEKKFINYRDLSVQQLGSIYERLLEYEPVLREDGNIEIQLNPYARKSSGSYYTPDELVALIVDQTVGPLVEERSQTFSAKAATLKSRKSPVSDRLSELRQHDLATALLELKVCDPAMGSGHFLVHLVDYLADHVIEALADAPKVVSWAQYTSPLAQRIAAIRSRILQEAKTNKWAVRPEQLEDRMIVRRMVLKRVVYGVDKNPMAVELAKVSLWLHTFTVGAPLSFLDHHLRCGDSLFGEWVGKTERELSQAAGLFIQNSVVRARQAARMMQQIETATDADLTEVRELEQTFGGVCEVTEPLNRFLGFWHALRWLGDEPPQRRLALDGLLRGTYGDPVLVAAGLSPLKIMDAEAVDEKHLSKRAKAERKAKQAAAKNLPALLHDAQALAQQEHFFHWEVAFPGVWADWESAEPKGGFDAVIGNPPWDRFEFEEVHWFADRAVEIALEPSGAKRKARISALKRANAPLWREYCAASARVAAATAVARGTQYHLLNIGKLNLYKLFVERGFQIVRPEGMVGMLTPSGIASDLSSSKFFKEVAVEGRLKALYDFENRRTLYNDQPFFPDVDSRFKFCVVVASPKKRFSAASYASFLHDVSELSAPERCFSLSASDFSRLNPNTGTAPIFITRRDAELTKSVYKTCPVLIDRSHHEPRRLWPISYSQMVNMTSDSHLFRTKTELEEREHAFPVSGNCWRTGDSEWIPLYEGKMVQAFDHRAASVVVNLLNVHRPAQPEPASVENHQDPNWAPAPQFWIKRGSTEVPE